MKKNNKKGLTLIELLAVIAIIAILFILLIPQISSAINKAREASVMTDFRSYEIAIKDYMQNTIGKDRSVTELNKYLSKNLQGVSGETKKIDPYGQKYRIGFVNYYKKAYVVSLGEDGNLKSLIIKEKDGEIISYSTGFENNIGGTVTKKHGEFKYHEEDGKIVITAYTGKEKDIVIPNQIEGKDVTIIANNAFSERKLKSVVLPNKLEILEVRAFRSNELTEINFPNTLKIIEGATFESNKLSKVILPNSVEYVGSWTFPNNQITSVVISEGMTKIDDSVFSNNKISSVSIPSNIKNINSRAFIGNPITSYAILGNPNISETAFPTTAIRN